MRDIKESFFHFVSALRNAKELAYFRCKALRSGTGRSSRATAIEEIYANRIDGETGFFHYSRVGLKLVKAVPSRLAIKKTRHDIYYYGYRPLRHAGQASIVHHLPRLSWLRKEALLTLMISSPGSCASRTVRRNTTISKEGCVIAGRLFNLVNFLVERINRWALCSIFLWPDVLTADKSGEPRMVFHLFGIYKRNKDLLNVEILFFKRHSDIKDLLRTSPGNAIGNNNMLSLISVDKKKKYAIMIHMDKLSKDSGVRDRKAMEAIRAEVTLALKYYSWILGR